VDYSWAKPGVECVCIEDADWHHLVNIGPPVERPTLLPEFMHTYVIKDVHAFECGAPNCKGHIMLMLTTLGDTWFGIGSFAPVQKIDDKEELEEKSPGPNKLELLTEKLNV
jgi:hypothetical protein